MNAIDFDYLASIPEAHPNPSSIRWGCSFDGRQLALVGYILEPNGNWVHVGNTRNLEAELDAVVFFAATVPGCTITRAVKVFDQVAAALKLGSLTLYTEGALGRTEVFVRHIKKHSNHEVKLFRENQGKWFQAVEVMAAVADDQSEGRIKLSPSFGARPEKNLLDEATGVIEEKLMNPLQEAFVYGLGYWSCRERRKKYFVGGSRIRVW